MKDAYWVVVRAGTQEGGSESSHDQRSLLLFSEIKTEDTLYPYTNVSTSQLNLFVNVRPRRALVGLLLKPRNMYAYTLVGIYALQA